MNITSFTRMVQTFGSDPKRWESDDIENAESFAATPMAAEITAEEAKLDKRLDLFSVPFRDNLNERLYAAIMSETGRKFMFLFIRHSTWISLLFMIGGFYLGWRGSHQHIQNEENYFRTMFDVTIY